MNCWIAALLAVVLYWSSFPPLDLGVLGFVALIPWCTLARSLRGGRLFWVGYACGLGVMGTSCFWLVKSHPLNLVLMLVFEALFFGAFAWVLRFLLVRKQWPAWLSLPVLFVATEWTRSTTPLEGFPWLLLGYSQHRYPWIVQCADLASVFGVSFVLAAVAGFLDDAMQSFRGRRRRQAFLTLCAACVLVGLVLTYGAWCWRTRGDLEKGPRLLLVQGNIPQSLKRAGPSQPEILGIHLALSKQGLQQSTAPVDCVIWSETVLWLESSRAEELIVHRVIGSELLQPFQVSLLTGAVTVRAAGDDDAPAIQNSAILYDSSGGRLGLYHKSILVPGGEYVPFLSYLPRWGAEPIRRLIRAMAGEVPSLYPGAGAECFDLPSADHSRTFRVGVTICYENCYPSYGRSMVASGAEFLVNLSNEAWFPDSSEFEQYTAMAVFRAVEVRRSLVRAANSGTTAVIDPWGHVRALEQDGATNGFAGIMVAEPDLDRVESPYQRWGDVLPWTCVGVLLLLLFLPHSVTRGQVRDL